MYYYGLTPVWITSRWESEYIRASRNRRFSSHGRSINNYLYMYTHTNSVFISWDICAWMHKSENFESIMHVRKSHEPQSAESDASSYRVRSTGNATRAGTPRTRWCRLWVRVLYSGRIKECRQCGRIGALVFRGPLFLSLLKKKSF